MTNPAAPAPAGGAAPAAPAPAAPPPAAPLQTRAQFDTAVAGAPNGMLWLRDWIPLTGLGRFDAVYRPRAGELSIEVRVFWTFCQLAPQGEAPVPGGQWPAAEQQRMVEEFRRQVEAAWSSRFVLVCTAPGYTDLRAAVRVRVTRVTDIAQAHFHLRMGEDRTSTGWGREQADQQPGGPRIINVGNFARANEQVRPHDSERTRERMVTQAGSRVDQLLAVHLNPIRFEGGGSTTLDADTQARLASFVAAYRVYRERMPDLPDVALVAVGKRTGREKSAVESERAQTTAAALARQGLPLAGTGQVLASSRVAALEASLKRVKDAEIQQSIRDDITQEKARADGAEAVVEADLAPAGPVWPGVGYSVFAHEFGHMLGNPDEYYDYGSVDVRARIADRYAGSPYPLERYCGARVIPHAPLRENPDQNAIQDAVVRLADGAAILPPEFGPFTPSIMSTGAVVQRVHYLPIWQAMTQLMRAATPPESWRIEAPGPADGEPAGSASGVRFGVARG